MFMLLKMLGLYVDTLIIGHKLCSMLSTLDKLPLQKEWQSMKLMIFSFFGQENKRTTTTKQNKQT